MRPVRDVVVNMGHVSAPGTRDWKTAVAAVIRRGVMCVLDAEGVADAEISVTLLDDESIRAMNREYLGKDRPTDVIAFSLGDAGETLGDVYLGADQARRQADELSVDHREELVRLAIHGTLHVLGHDHPEGDDRDESPMYQLQERLLREVLAGE